MTVDDVKVEWNQSDMVEVELIGDSFLKVQETLTRIGIANVKKKKLWQTCNILHKQGKYYIVHYKEMFGLDGLEVNFKASDVSRRNKIISMLVDWGMIKVKSPDFVFDENERVFVLKHSEKSNWELISKYHIGKRRK